MSKKSRNTNRSARAEVAAAERRQQARRERSRTLAIGALVVAVLAALITTGVVLTNRSSEVAVATTAPVRMEGPALVLGKSGGGSDSKVHKVVIYEDFLCPYCREFEASTRDALHRAAERGTAEVEYRPFHLLGDHYSTDALAVFGAVAQHGTPEQALKLHDLLYDNQPYEDAADKPGIDQLTKLAEKAGVSDGSVLKAAAAHDHAYADEADAAATAAGVRGTPTVFVDGTKLTGTSISDMATQLESLLS